MNAAELIQRRKLLRAKFWSNPARPVADPPQIKPSCVVAPLDREEVMAAMLPRRTEPIRVAADAVLMHVTVPKSRSREIIEEVAAKHGLQVKDITGPARTRRIVNARHEAAYRLRDETDLSFPQIGRLIGNRDHTSALHGVRMHAARISKDAAE